VPDVETSIYDSMLHSHSAADLYRAGVADAIDTHGLAMLTGVIESILAKA
jgi:hypothetical protein